MNRNHHPPTMPRRRPIPAKSPSNPDWKPDFRRNHRYDRPPPPSPPPLYGGPRLFKVELRSSKRPLTKSDLDELIAGAGTLPEVTEILPSGHVAKLAYKKWIDALEATVHIWRIRLKGHHLYTPWLMPSACDMNKLWDKLNLLFTEHVRELIDGESVQKWQRKLKGVGDELGGVQGLMRKHNKLSVYEELTKKKARLETEKGLIEQRISEFVSSMECVLDKLEERRTNEDWKVFDNIKIPFDWVQLDHIIRREVRRLEDGLPIYAFRQKLLSDIYNQQVLVLIGETGSGKSTQLVQFLADSGVAGNGSIICTQPRKLAATSLAQRVQEESYGCYQDNTVISCPTHSSMQLHKSKVVFMTDHCLLQYYMNDKMLSSASCIIVDEAHERSLNTDLLLALLKSLLPQRQDLRLIIMSATVDANQLADYFFGCGTFHVVGRNFPVDIRYVPCASELPLSSATVPSYVSDVVRLATEIHREEKGGTILAFLTSQQEVEWACEKFQCPNAVALALHGKLAHDDQHRVFLDYPGKRKVIFATNVAETSLTIPGVKYVVDSGMMKDSRFEPGTGMNVLKVCRISQSSANQRAGRAGRTEPGRCYRLYSEYDFDLMPSHQEPEIRKAHLGVAVLRILALGIGEVQNFDFVDAPSVTAIDMAIRNLIQLGAVVWKNDVLELTDEGLKLVRLGIEPRLGKIIFECFTHHLGREGLVLAAVMANASSIFCRVGNEEDKLKSDCLKVQFCHRYGDLFTLLSVYKEWDNVPREMKNKWCWENKINAKSMRRCQDTVNELEACLKSELNLIIPSYWLWNPQVSTVNDTHLKNAILSSLAENIAMYSGYDQLGYKVALTGKHVALHPSCSLRMFDQRPSWVVFGDILSASNEYLVCVTAFDYEYLSTLSPPPLFDISKMESESLQVTVISGLGCTLLKKLCGKFKSNLLSLVSRVRKACMDERIGIEVNVDQNEIRLFASSQDIEEVTSLVSAAVEYERRLLQNECIDKCLYHGGPGLSSPVALFGAGAEIKHLELEKRCMTVDVSSPDLTSIDDKELLMFVERSALGNVCAVYKAASDGKDTAEERWGRIIFLTPDAAERASKLSPLEFNGSQVVIAPSRNNYGGDNKSFGAVRAKVCWLRRRSKGVAFVRCEVEDVDYLINDFSNLVIGGRRIRCEPSMKFQDGFVIKGLDTGLTEAEILNELSNVTDRKILDLHLKRGDPVDDPPPGSCEAALLREISPFMPKNNFQGVRVEVFQTEPMHAYMKALVIFDGRLHLEAAKALEQIDGKVLSGCQPWQKIKCQQLFQSSMSCPRAVYFVIQEQLQSLLTKFRNRKGAKCMFEQLDNGSCRVKISANATKTVAELRRPLEQLMRGTIVDHPSLTPAVKELLFLRDGIALLHSLKRETRTYIFFDRHSHNIRIYGSPEKIALAQQRLVQSLKNLYDHRQLEIHLRGGSKPPDLMKEVVKKFGPDLLGLKEKFPCAAFTLNTRRHIISISGNPELKQQVEDLISELQVMNTSSPNSGGQSETTCPICLCEVEDAFRLEDCRHVFCRSCLLDQCQSAIKNKDAFPMRCMSQGCGALILVTDLKSLLSGDKLDELFRASLGSFVASSTGKLRFCPSPDCPSVYRVSDPKSAGTPFLCGACGVETCTSCHLEYHPFLSCDMYKQFKEDPDSSLKAWCKEKGDVVKHCPVCGYTIEKTEGCNHIECRCGKHICWNCLEVFSKSEDCYDHLTSVHLAII